MTPAARSRATKIAICLALIILVAAVFGRAIHHDFVNYDDPSYVTQNQHVLDGLSLDGVRWAFTHSHSANWHPLTTMSHMLDCSIYGTNPAGPHAENVALHAIAAALLFLLLQSLTGSYWRSALVAALFAVHPLRAESVAWISERKDVLSAVFFMITLLSYAWYAKQPAVARMVGVWIALALGLMAKPMLVTTPVLLLLLDVWPLRRIEFEKFWSSARRPLLEKLPLFALAAASCAATIAVQRFAIGTTEYLPLRWRVNNAIDSYVQYVKQLFWPADLVPFYPHVEGTLSNWWLAGEAIALLFVSVAVWWARRQRPHQLVGWAWYLVTLLPVIGLVQVGLQGHADRYTYIPHIGLLIALTWSVPEALTAVRARRYLVTAVGVVLVAIFSVLAWRQTGYWHDSGTLWRRTLTIHPDDDVAHAALGGVLQSEGQTREAMTHYERALEIRPGNVAAENGLAVAYTQLGNVDRAIEHWNRMLEVLPDSVDARVSLGLLYAQQSRLREALEQWQIALRFDETNAAAANNAAWILATSPDAASRDGERAVRLAETAVRSTRGKSALQLLTLAAAYAEVGRFDQAIAAAKRAKEANDVSGEERVNVDTDAWIAQFRNGEAIRDERE